MKQLNWYQIFGQTHTIPDGRTVTPTDDIQIWLNCADIWDKTYTTLAEVLADTTTLLALINSSNAVDYMVRSTTWAKGASIPVMTSDTTPSGVCSASSVYSGYPAWYAFDDNFSYYWNSANEGISDYIQYEFPQKVRVDRFKIIIENNSVAGFHNITLSCGDTESDLVNHGNFTLEASTDLQTFEINADLNAKIFRLTSQAESGKYGCVRLLNFYSIGITDDSAAMSYIGLNNYCANTLLADSTWKTAICLSEYKTSVLNVKVPAMTSNTTPSGECSATSVYSYGGNYFPAYLAFDGDVATRWIGVSFPNTVYYQFTEATKIYAFTYKGESVNNTAKDISLVDGNNGVIESYTAENTADLQTFVVSNPTTIQKYGLKISNPYGGASNSVAKVVQFYGREDV